MIINIKNGQAAQYLKTFVKVVFFLELSLGKKNPAYLVKNVVVNPQGLNRQNI